MKSDNDKMLDGEVYDGRNAELIEELRNMNEKIHDYNLLRPKQMEERTHMIRGILGKCGKNVFVNQPFYCDYGRNIEVGDYFFSNFNLTILDEAKVTIGAHAFIGPNTNIYTAVHPVNPEMRNQHMDSAKPVSIGDNVWIGGNVTILPGVTIGNNVTIGAGSVVVKSIPDNCVAVGNPCKPIKSI